MGKLVFSCIEKDYRVLGKAEILYVIQSSYLRWLKLVFISAVVVNGARFGF